jgi:predicted small metal-binding protein
MVVKMTSYSFRCKDIGMDCGFETKADSMESLMPKITQHAREAHKMNEISEELKKKVSAAIKTMH